MKHNYLKHLFTALLLVCCIGMAKAEEVTINGIKYDVVTETKKATVIRSGNYSGNIVIPSEITYNDVICSVTSIGDYAFSECVGLTSVVIPNSVTSIGDDAFYYCTGLTSIEIPSSVTSIGGAAFYYCTGLTSIEIPSSVTSIGGTAFMYCKGLTSIEIPGSVTSIGEYAFFGCYGLTSIEIPGSVTSIGEDAFSCCDSLKEVYISDLAAWCSIDFGNGVANPLCIAENLYLNGELVTELVIPDGVNEIKNYAFYSFDALTNVVIGNSVTSIGKSVFMYCDGLVSIEIPNSVTSIGNSAFHSCTGLTSIEIPNGVTSIGKEAFRDCTGLTSVVIPNSVTSIGNSAFYECHSLTSIEIPGSVTSIGDRVFMQCDGLTSVVIGNGVTSIGYEAFYYCDGLTSVEIPNSVTSIGGYAFSYCSALTRIVIPNSVTSIGGSAFWNCTSLKTVVNFSNLTFSMGTTSHGYIACYANKVFNAPNVFIDGDYIWLENEDGMTLATYWGDATELILPTEFNGKSVTSIGEFAFENCTSLTSIEIPNSVKSIGCGAFNGTAWYENQPEGLVYAGKVLYDYKGAMPSNTSITIKDGTLGISGYAFSSCSGLTSVVIPNSVTNIGRSAFYSCSGLTSIEIPNSVTSIGNSAFYSCSGLTSIEIPNGVTSIENYAFSYCSALTRIVIPNSVTSIGYYAFKSCSSLTSIEIPNSVTSIGYEAFANCTGLTSIEIPNSVTSIGYEAFEYCTGLTSVEIGNSVTSIGYYAFSSCSSLTSITSLIPTDKLFIPSSGAFYNVNKNTCTLYVPSGAKETYAATSGWKDFKNIVEIIGGSCGANVNWMLKDGVLTISGSGAMDDYSVDTMPWYEYKSEIKSVIINSGVTSIGGSAFEGCSGITSIEIPNSVTSIVYKAFKNCTGLTSIEIPNSVTSIGKDAFLRCNNLTSVELPSSLTIIEEGAFSRTGLIEVTIPEGVTSLGKWAFDNSPALSKVSLPTTLTSIGENAFENCTGLTSITIPNSVTSIGDEAFYGCTALKTVINNSDLDIEEGSTSNGYVAYYANEVIITDEFKFELVDGVYTLVKYRGKGIKQKEMTTFDSWTSTNKGQSSSTSSHKYTFDATVGSKFSFDWSVSSEANYDKLYVILDGTTVLTKSGVYSGNYEQTFTVAGSHTLEVEYTKDGSVDSNNDEAKIYNVKLARTINIPADVVLPDNYEGEPYVIGESAFENNENVASVTIPEGVEMICDKAFSGCSNLENIVIPNSVSAIGGDAFAGTKWYDNKEDGMVYAGNVLYKYKGSMPENTAITINDGILGIAGSAFANCTGLTSITSLIPADNLFVPGSDAFVGVDKTNCTLYVPYGAKETYAATEGWEDFKNIVEIIPAEITITINQYGNVTFCSDLALDFSNVEGLKAYAATGYKSNSQVVTLTRVQTAKAGIGLFLKAEPGEYVVPVIESTDEHSLNLLVGTLEETVVNSTDGAMSNYKFTIADGDTAPMFYPFEDNTTFSAGKAYLQIPTAWLPVTAQKSLSIRFDDGETTDIDEVKGEGGIVKTIYDLQGRVVENPTSGIYIIDGKKVVIK